VLSDLQMSDGSFCEFTRITSTDFEVLLQMVGSSVAKNNTEFRDSLKAETRLAITVRVWASGDSCTSQICLKSRINSSAK
jgi:hypothetical protein